MNWIEKVRQAVGYIEANLLEDITIEDIGRAINYAPSSFSGLFSAVTGYSVGEYVRFRRLSCAVDDLRSGAPVTDIAFKYGYETAEAFSKAFRRLFDCAPSKYFDTAVNPKPRRFHPIAIDFSLKGGFHMTRHFIPGLSGVDWSDPARQNEFVNSVISALGALGERLRYDDVCAVSGAPFRMSFGIPRGGSLWNHGNYHVIHTPDVIGHTFKMLGYTVTHYKRGDYAQDKKRVMDSIDRGVPAVTLEGVIDCAEACVISGYDNDGGVLLGYSPFMNIPDDHDEAPDDTGCFRKSRWHDGFSAEGSELRILIIEGKGKKPSKEESFHETLLLAKRLIGEESLAPGQYNGLAAHRAFAEALLTYEWDDNSEPYLNVMCNQKMYLDRQYAVRFFDDNNRPDLARVYEKIAGLADRMRRLIPQDFSVSALFGDKSGLKPYCDAVLEVCRLEEEALRLMG